MPENELLTVKEVAEYLRLSEYTVRKIIRQKRLAGKKLGREYRIKRSDLQKLVEEKQTA